MAKLNRRWIPAIAIPVVIIAAGAIVVPMSANAAPDLPTKTPQQVLALLTGSTEDSFSGTMKVTSDLGLPSISTGPGSAASNLDLLISSYSARVYVDGPTKARVQVLDSLAERDAIINGTDVWAYSSKDNTVEHATLPTGTPRTETTKTPDSVATSIVAALEPTSDLSVTTAQRVAGRSAYTLVLTPKTDATLVGSVKVAVDSESGLPLSVSVTARGETSPAWQVAFTSVDLATPSDVFAFVPPKDSSVKQITEPTTKPTVPDATAKPTVTGTGWASIVSLSAGDLSDLTSNPQFLQLSSPVSGGRVIHTALLNVLITDGGKVLAGSVLVSALQAAAQ